MGGHIPSNGMIEIRLLAHAPNENELSLALKINFKSWRYPSMKSFFSDRLIQKLRDDCAAK